MMNEGDAGVNSGDEMGWIQAHGNANKHVPMYFQRPQLCSIVHPLQCESDVSDLAFER